MAKTKQASPRATLWDTLEPDKSQNIYCQRDNLSNEASVETFFVSRFLKDLGYQDNQIKTKESIESREVGPGHKKTNYKPDYLLMIGNKPCCVVDAKGTEEALNKWLFQCSGYCLSINQDYASENPVKYFVLSNGITTQVYEWDNKQPLLSLDFADFTYGNPKLEQFKTLLAPTSIAKSAAVSTLKAHDFTFIRPSGEAARQLFASCHQTIWKSDGIAPGPAFMEFVKVMFVKLWCDRRLRENEETGKFFEDGSPTIRLPKSSITFSQHWIEQQESGGTVNPLDSNLFSTLRNEIERNVQLRKKKRLFNSNERITLSSDTIKRVVAKLEHYDMFGIDEDLNGRLFETFLSATMRGRALGQFFTPRSIVKMMTRIADLQANTKNQDRVIDACCGSGGFLIEALTMMRDSLRHNKSLSAEKREELVEIVANQCLFGIDFGKDPPLARIARINMYLHGDGGSRIYYADALDKDIHIAKDIDPEVAQNIQELKDDLAKPIEFDVALTNPPFSMTKEIKNEGDRRILSRYELARRDETSLALRSSLRSSQMFIERYHDLLKTGGRLITVIDDTVLASDNEAFRTIRHYIRQKFLIRAIISLPGDAFRRQGARVKTSVLLLEKKSAEEDTQPSCFAYFSEFIGVDDLTPRASEADVRDARSKADNEASQIIEGYQSYLAGKLPAAGIVLPPELTQQRLDLKYCVPQSGRLVNEWKRKSIEVKPFSQCVTLSMEEIIPTQHPEKVFKLIKVTYNGICELERERKGKAIRAGTMYRVKEGQLVFSTIRATDGAIGIVPKELDGALVSGSYSVFTVGPEDYDTAYLWAILRSHELRADMQSLSPGSGRYTTYWPNVGVINVPWPSQEERKAIGKGLLDAWELERKVVEDRKSALDRIASLGVESDASVSRWRSSKAPT